MAYLLTAIMTGCVAAMISIFTGGGFMQVLWNYILFGHLGMATLALATVASTLIDRKHRSDA
ncbi:hypothetical protein [uncultured Sulfitobacter sp.]|uniref:hypothetical protein n=1 Tax=uncultured Sulfitobacter sp. TaxID=191468 RepID=UPI00261D9388|nr:hypothetical protein [uncultured Sulfitobacter sp.]